MLLLDTAEQADLTRGQLISTAFDAVATPELAGIVLQVVDSLPEYSHSLLDVAIAATQMGLDATTDAPARAMLGIHLAVRLRQAGRREDALTVIDEAVAIYRQLATARPDAFLPDLASSLNNRSTMLSDLGRSEDALTVIDEAVAILRQLAAARPDVRHLLLRHTSPAHRLGAVARPASRLEPQAVLTTKLCGGMLATTPSR